MIRPATFLLGLAVLVSACGGATGPSTNTPRATLSRAPAATTPPESSCSAVMVQPTPGAANPSLFPPVGPGDHVLGPDSASVTLLAYSDFQCGGCAELASLFRQLRQLYPDDLRIVFREFPTTAAHDKAELAARAAETAGDMGEFWKMHDLLYDKLGEWNALKPQAFEGWLIAQAPGLGLDGDEFAKRLRSDEIAARVSQAVDDGLAIGLPGVPILLVNGQLQVPPINAYTLDQVIRLIRMGKRQFTSCPPFVINPARQYLAILRTAAGEAVIQLYADKAPNTVNNFVFLARKGWFDGTTFHRVIPGFIAQAGDPSGTGLGNPGYFIPDEINPSLKFDRPGLVAMANSGPDTNGAQFFITFSPAGQLNGSYTIFGEVIRGLDVLTALTPRDPQPGSMLAAGDALLSVTVEEK